MDPKDIFLKNIETVESRLQYEFKSQDLLVLAFTHRSFFNEHRQEVKGHNERLEFLGDAILGLIVSSFLYSHLPTESEGVLSNLRAHLVGAESCFQYLLSLGVEGDLMLGRGEAVNMGKGRERILADLFEAIVGAIYLDGGLKAAEAFVQGHCGPFFLSAMEQPLRNWKAELQDYSQKKFQKPPEYRVLEEAGPPHDKQFTVAVFIEEGQVGKGMGSSKKQAEQAAAQDALGKMEQDGED